MIKGRLDLEDVELMTLPTLFDRLRSVRRVRARMRADEFQERIAAARGTEESVRAITEALGRQGGVTGPPAGDVNDLAAALGGWA